MSIEIVEIIVAGSRGPAGVPGASTEPGGSTFQVLMKQSDTEFDATWGHVDALNTSFNSNEGVVATDVEGAVDEVHVALGVERVRVDTNVADILVVDGKADDALSAATDADTKADAAVVTADAANVLASTADGKADINLAKVDALLFSTQITASYTGVDIDSIFDAGFGSVDTNLPYSLTSANLQIIEAPSAESNLKIQQLTECNDFNEYFRLSFDGVAWGGWSQRVLSGRISNLEAWVPFAPAFDYVTVTDFTVTGDVYEEVARLTTPVREAGTYKLDKAIFYTLDSTTTSAYFRFSLDDGASWTEVREEPKDTTDIRPLAHPSMIGHTGGTMDIVIEARKENAGDVLLLKETSLILERKI